MADLEKTKQSVVTYGDTTETTAKDPTTSVEQKVTLPNYQYIDADGNVQTDPARLATYNQQVADVDAAMQKKYNVDASGKYIGPVGDLFNFDPERFAKDQEEKAKLERFKQKEAGWSTALNLISDIVSAGAGGNVWKRQPNTISKEAGAKADNYLDIAAKTREAVPAAIRAREMAAQDERLKRMAQLIKDNSSTVSIKNTSGGGSQKVTTRGNTITNTYGNGKTAEDMRIARSRAAGNEKVVTILKRDANGNVIDRITMSVPKSYADAYADNVATELQLQFEQKKLSKETINNLINAGIYDPAAKDPLKRWNRDKILSYGRTFTTNALDEQLQELWTMSGQYDGNSLNLGEYTGEITTPPVETTGSSRIKKQQVETRKSTR